MILFNIVIRDIQLWHTLIHVVVAELIAQQEHTR